jgi:hypothetical protein
LKLKFDPEGKVVVKEVNGEKMPVYIHDDGKEVEFDAANTVATIARLSADERGYRKKASELSDIMKTYEGLDATKAREALKAVENIDLKKLVDAGEVDKVKSEVAKVYDLKISERDRRIEELEGTLYQEKVGGAFTRSKMVSEKFAVPADMVEARFGKHFGIENGKVYAADAAGNKLYSRSRPGELADFDEAIMILVDQYPYKDTILKGAGSSGSGSPANGGGSGGSKTVTRSQFDSMSVAERSTIAKAAATGEVTLVD